METKKAKRIDLRASEADETNLKLAAQKLGTKKVSETIFGSLAEFANQPDEIFFVNRVAVKETQTNVNAALLLLQAFCTEYKRITAQNCNIEDLQTMLTGLFKFDGEKILQQAITEHIKNKLYDQLIKSHPDMTVSFDNVPAKDLSGLFEIAVKLNFIPEVQGHTAIYWNTYSVNGNIVSIKQDELEKLLQSYRFFASGPQQLLKLNKVRKLCELQNELLSDPDLIPEKIHTLTYFDKESNRFEATGSYIIFNTR